MTRTFAFAAGLLMVGFAGFCAGTFGFDSVPAWVSVLAVVVLALPSLVVCFRSFGFKHGAILIGGLSVFAMAIETIGVATGYPYGAFYYSGEMGWKLFDLVPWTVAFAWTPLLFTASTVSRNALVTAILLVAMDLVLDPGAVATGLWTYTATGDYYGVPWTNFVGWLLSGYLGAFLLYQLLPSGQSRLPSGFLISGSLSLAFWTGVVIALGFVIPGVVGVALAIFFLITYFEPRNSKRT